MVHILLTSFTLKTKEVFYVFRVPALKNISYISDKPTNSRDRKEGYRKSNATPSGFIIHFVQLFYTDFILVIWTPDDDHISDQNMYVKNNNVIENIYKCVAVCLSYKYWKRYLVMYNVRWKGY
jgi:hypothetical protein